MSVNNEPVFETSKHYISPSKLERKKAKTGLDAILHANILQKVPSVFDNEKYKPFSERLPDDISYVKEFLSILGYNQNLDNGNRSKNYGIATEKVNDTYFLKILDSLKMMSELENKSHNMGNTINLKKEEKFAALQGDYQRYFPNNLDLSGDIDSNIDLYDYYLFYKKLINKTLDPDQKEKLMLYYMRASYLSKFINAIPNIESHRSVGAKYYSDKIARSIKKD